MSDHIIEPGEFSCEWLFEDAWHPGTVLLQPGQHIEGEIYHKPSADNESPTNVRHRQHQRLPMVVGRLRNGFNFTVLDARLQRWWIDRSLLTGRFAICGPAVNGDKDEYDEVEFQISGLTAFAGDHPLEYPEVPDDVSGVTVKWREGSDQTCQSGEDTLELFFERKISMSGPYRCSVTTRPLIRARGNPRTLEKWLDQYVNPLRNIISLSLIQDAHCSWLALGNRVFQRLPDGRDSEHTIQAQVFGRELSQDHFDASASDLARRPLISTGPKGVPLDELVARWRSANTKYGTFLELLVVGLTENLSARAAFLTIVPALESYHSELSGDREQIIALHQDKRSDVLERLKVKCTATDYRWIKDWLDRRGTPSLERRLRKIYASLDQELRDQIDVYIGNPPPSFGDIRPKANDIWEKLGALRNDLAHGGQSHPPKLIEPATRLVQTVAVAVLLLEMGVEQKQLAKEIKEGLWRVM